MSDPSIYLRKIKGLEVETGVPVAGLTTWRVGGNADALVRALELDALKPLLAACLDSGVAVTVMGSGSNVLVSDEGLRGVVLILDAGLTPCRVEGRRISAGAGALLGSVARKAAGASLGGMEFASGIPGTVGGAVMTNAGAFSADTASVTRSVKAVTMSGEERDYTGFEHSYRTALVPREGVIVSVTFELVPAERGSIEENARLIREKRKASQPVASMTAGSVFKNPRGDHAGRLIEECGLKGESVGGASISDFHANFIINTGGARAADIKALIDLARREVSERFGIDLELEVELLGFSEE